MQERIRALRFLPKIYFAMLHDDADWQIFARSPFRCGRYTHHTTGNTPARHAYKFDGRRAVLVRSVVVSRQRRGLMRGDAD